MNDLYILQYIGLVIEMAFFFVMIRNWYMKNTFMKSAFFYFTTLKIIGDFVFMLYIIVTTWWFPELMPLDYYTYFFLGYFYNEIDALSQFAISINRYTALMMPFKHKQRIFMNANESRMECIDSDPNVSDFASPSTSVVPEPEVVLQSQTEPQWTEEDIERNFILVRKILRKLGLRIRIFSTDLTLTMPFQEDPLMEYSIFVENYLPDYFQIKVESKSQEVAEKNAKYEFCRLMECNCLVTKVMYDAWTKIYPLYLNHPHLFNRIGSKAKNNFNILNSAIPIYVNVNYPQGNCKKIINKVFEKAHERLNADPDTIENYIFDLPDPDSCAYHFQNEYGVVPNSGRFKNIISQLKHCRMMFPQEFHQFESDVREYVEIFEEKESEKILKIQAVERLMEDIKTHPVLRDGKLIVFGSTMNTTAVSNADLDLYFYLGKNHERKHLLLNQLFHHLNQSSQVSSIIHVDVAKVPILQVAMKPPFENIRIEISSNSDYSIYTTFLVRKYLKLDSRARYLSILIKQWAVIHKIKVPSHGTMSGISLILMVIHFLQCGCDPPILPNLQFVRKDIFSEDIPIELLLDREDLVYPGKESFPFNDATLGELFIAFFDYYSNFDFDQDAINLAEGGITSRDFLHINSDKRGMYVDEPFAHFNTLRSLVDFDLVLRSIKDGFELLDGPHLHRKFPDFRRLMHQVFRL
ncbi:hypothetical protein FO519_007802 [Halicephalobus sp. NKZ332]|nr:hypothetical protein FO519_007802 [Halicephalobus sp. NKZ332]